jgi:DMSO/TMAO reductase YedYZ heme-binding membrane subunit
VPLLLRGILWVQLYLLVSVAPLLFALLGDTPPGRDFLTELSVALGFVGLSMLGLQFVITARFGNVAAPYGMDVVIRFHRGISLVAFTFVLAHPILLFVTDPSTLELLRFWDAPWRARFGLLSVVGLVAIVITSLRREQLGLSYEVWKVAHGVLAVLVVATALLHVQLVGYYVDTVWKQALWAAMSLALVGVLATPASSRRSCASAARGRSSSVEDAGGDAWHLTVRPVGHPGLPSRCRASSPGWWSPPARSPSSSTRSRSRATPSTPRAPPVHDQGARRLERDVGDGRAGHPGRTWTARTARSPRTGPKHPGTCSWPAVWASPPILGILHTLAARGDQRPMTVVHADRTIDDLTGRDDLARCRAARPRGRHRARGPARRVGRATRGCPTRTCSTGSHPTGSASGSSTSSAAPRRCSTRSRRPWRSGACRSRTSRPNASTSIPPRRRSIRCDTARRTGWSWPSAAVLLLASFAWAAFQS